MYRRVEEVAESFQERHERPGGWRWSFEDGVQLWNVSLERTKEFVSGEREPNLLIVNYHDFFVNSEAWAELLSAFLGLNFTDQIVNIWRSRNAEVKEKRRSKLPLTEEQRLYIQQNKDHAAEAWALDYIESQRVQLLSRRHNST